MGLAAETPRPRLATLEDFTAIPEGDRFHEFIDGMIIRKAMPVGPHARSQANLVRVLGDYDGPGDGEHRGGWWFFVELEIDFPALNLRLRPDLSAWRTSTMSEPPERGVPSVRPDWVCEVISPDRRTYDLVDKRRYYQSAGVPHYWLLDYEPKTLTVLSLKDGRYVTELEAGADDVVKASPFADLALPVSRLFR